jgi:ribokinase
MTDFIVVGDVMVDLLAAIDQPLQFASDTPAVITRSLGGSAANTAAWLGTHGYSVRLIAATGDDEARAEILAGCKNRNIDAFLERIDGARTGTCIVIIDHNGERTMLPDTGANAALTHNWASTHLVGDHLHLSAYPLFQPDTAASMISLLEQCTVEGKTSSIDLASAAPLRAHRSIVLQACEFVDIIFTNEYEARALLNEPVDSPHEELMSALSNLAPLTVLKCGQNGAWAILNQDRIHHPALQVPVADTTGAGDAFAAGFLGEWFQTQQPAPSLEAGIRLASEVVQRVGAGPRTVHPKD